MERSMMNVNGPDPHWSFNGCEEKIIPAIIKVA